MAQKFVYRARNLAGRVVTGRVEADTQAAAIASLREKNLFVVAIRPALPFQLDLYRLLNLKVRVRDLAVFCRQFAAMSEAGIPLLQCLRILAGQTENRKLREIVRDAATDIEKGKALSEAFRSHREHLPDLLINMLAAAEVSGTVDQALARLAAHFEKEHELRQKIRSAMTYPLLVAGMSFLAVIALLVLVVPVFVDIFTQMGATLPLPTRVLIGVSTFLSRYWYLLLPVAVALALALRRAAATERGRRLADRILLRLPVAGPLARKAVVARFARTLATLLQSGVPLLQALETLEKVIGSSTAAEEIARARERIREGERMAPVLAQSAVFPPMAASMVAVGEESGALDELLAKLAAFYEQEVEAAIARLSGLVEPLLIAGVGVIVAFIALSIYLPLFNLAGVMQGGGMPAGMP